MGGELGKQIGTAILNETLRDPPVAESWASTFQIF